MIPPVKLIFLKENKLETRVSSLLRRESVGFRMEYSNPVPISSDCLPLLIGYPSPVTMKFEIILKAL
jgi:hypothetical protein